ncbi:MAG: nicotinate phosphoribosyltransferase [Armatimonadetes bacterium]|nr:nicotinate phosphoribosyltransferase [Armatimonadota bacterium]
MNHRPEPRLTFVTEDSMALLLDLYELTMAQSYFREGRNERATFELFVRSLPPRRGFLVSAGLDTVLAYLEGMRFTDEAITYLRSLRLFDEAFLGYLRGFRFAGDVRAIPEGEVFFPQEPLVEVTGTRIEAQIVETFLLNQINLQSMIATKAARVVIAAAGRPVVDFSARRDHGTDAAMKVARSSFLVGCAGTSNVLAGMVYGMPVYGTMAHSYVMSFDDELEGFRAYARHFPQNCTLLIDTYDTRQGARHAAIVARELRDRGQALAGVRLDSGDLIEQSFAVRRILDDAGATTVQIFASGDLNEDRIAAIVGAGAPIDAFGVGTEMGVSIDAPAFGGVYKLVEDAAGYRIKTSTSKVTLPGRKHVWRMQRDGILRDTIALAGEPPIAGARQLLEPVMTGGRRTLAETLAHARDRCRNAIATLPSSLRELQGGRADVRRSATLEALVAELSAAVAPS